MQTITKIIDASTNELSEALKIIWKNKQRLDGDTELKAIKENIDYAQSLLCDLLADLEAFDTKLVLEHYFLERP